MCLEVYLDSYYVKCISAQDDVIATFCEWNTSACTFLAHWSPNSGNFRCLMVTNKVVANTSLVVMVLFGLPELEVAPWELPELSNTVIALVGNVPPILFDGMYTIGEWSAIGQLFWFHCSISNFLFCCILVATGLSPRLCLWILLATALRSLLLWFMNSGSFESVDWIGSAIECQYCGYPCRHWYQVLW